MGEFANLEEDMLHVFEEVQFEKEVKQYDQNATPTVGKPENEESIRGNQCHVQHDG